MESLLVLFVYNRDKILKKCIETLFNNTSYKFDEILLINDGSTPEVTKNLMQFCLQNHNVEQPQFTLLNFGKNQGYGYTAEIAF
ncbi:MAG: glycosyltransferase, partial [Nanoarchaeota archaeon]